MTLMSCLEDVNQLFSISMVLYEYFIFNWIRYEEINFCNVQLFRLCCLVPLREGIMIQIISYVNTGYCQWYIYIDI